MQMLRVCISTAPSMDLPRSPDPPLARAPRLPRAMSSSSPPLSPRGAEKEGDTRSDGTGSGGGAVFSYGEAGYWDARYVEEGGAPYDWYQRYAALRPFVRPYVLPPSPLPLSSSRLLRIDETAARLVPELE
uniref:Predicted protein n=1 Tax=Hordeum vulgare subsp. vulgare TaxID=112509 RepID=F2E4G3_HORVV|nr:predicted protein [Hordeum vulgare subsp. vulgare]